MLYLTSTKPAIKHQSNNRKESSIIKPILQRGITDDRRIRESKKAKKKEKNASEAIKWPKQTFESFLVRFTA